MKDVLNSLKNGNLKPLNNIQVCNIISNNAWALIENPCNWDSELIELADIILRISNIAYNNTSLDVLPLDDGLYDQLLVIYKRYDPNYQVGAYPIHFEECPQNEIIDKKVMCTIANKKDMDSNLYMRELWIQNTPYNMIRPKTMCIISRDPITKRLINTQHKYPELVGTLDKCKFVLNEEARQKNVFDKPSVQIFERDFIHDCLNRGIITPSERFMMTGELKYDGVSVEAEVYEDTIISALSRGDTADNVATDLTPIFGGYKFPYAKDVEKLKGLKFGIKFEAVILKYDLQRLSEIRNKSYKNCRNAIIGLLGASDAYRYIDYITLIPLSSSLEMDRVSELIFLNKYYNSGEYNRYSIFIGNYQDILFQVKQFTEAAENLSFPYMIDGVVISFIDPDKINKLGRINSVNKYQMAIKFNPKKVRTTFIGYTYNIGKSGDVIPMAHFKPCEFIGAIHNKQTIHSYERFKDLNLAIGEQIDVEYVNEVISYVTKPDTEFNRSLGAKPESFISTCPYCGSSIVISPTGKSAKCPNVKCHERQIMRMVDMLNKLGFKDFAEESVRAINLTSFKQLVEIDMDTLSILGPNTSAQFMHYVNNLMTMPINDYKIMSALSFDGMADEKWKLVLNQYTIKELMSMNYDELQSAIGHINGVGPKVVESIITGRYTYDEDLKYVLSLNIIDYKGTTNKPRVAFTGFRDSEYTEILVDNGFDADDNYGVTKNTAALITNDLNSNSSKMKAARKNNIPIYTRQQFLDINNIKI